jgi:hypothetical protein
VIAAAEHRLRALQLRKKGHTYREIGLQLDMSEQRAHQHVIEGLRRLNTERSELAEEVPQLELERLDTTAVLTQHRLQAEALAADRGLQNPCGVRASASSPSMALLEPEIAGP